MSVSQVTKRARLPRASCEVVEQLESRLLLATFTVTNTANAGAGSLRQAVIDANTTPSSDEIEFNIPAGGGVATITLASELPAITQPLSILGGTQPGSSINTLEHGTDADILVSVAGQGNGIGINIRASNCVIRGLSIGRFFRGIEIRADGARIEGNFIGVDPDGETATPNAVGIFSDASGCAIGGSGVGTRNLISGNSSNGVELVGGNGVQVQGNLIGTTHTGEAALRNIKDGLALFAGAVISNNVISGNQGSGVLATGKNVSLHGNRIGVGSRGVTAVPNDRHGILVAIGRNIRIGDLDQRPNVIAHNGEHGIRISANSRSVLILNNVTRDNAKLGIDLAGGNEDSFGTTANDAQDVDGGANRLQNWPILTSASTSTGRTAIIGTLNSTPNTAFTIEFYGNFTADPSGHGEGAVRLGDVIVNTDGNGNAMFSVAGPATLADFISATATDNTALETSEFSTSVSNQKPFTTIPVTSNAGTGKSTLFDAIAMANNMPGVQGIRFDLPAGSETITLGGEAGGSLPLIFDPVIIDGSTQPGFSGVPLVHLTQSASLTNGLALRAEGSAVTWMTFSRFVIDAVSVIEFGQNVIAYNQFGTVAAGNNRGVAVNGGNGNLIIGNTFINSAGGVNPGALTFGGSSNNMIVDNRFGVTIDGTALGNAEHAIRISVVIFGEPAGDNIITRNIVANSTLAGISIPEINGGSVGNRILDNSIYNNGGLGIDLHNTGVNPNDVGDNDTGGNNRQNFPLLTSAAAAAMGGINVVGTLNSTANTMFRIDAYANDTADPTNHGEGRYWLGASNVTTNGSGNASVNALVAAEAIHSQKITATATDPQGNTSEFGPNVTFVDAAGPLVLAQSFGVEFGLEYVLRLNEDVTVQTAAAHLSGVTRLSDAVAADFDPITVAFDPLTNEATFVFQNNIPDGNYRITLNPALVTDAAGNPLPAPPPPLNTFILVGDANRDRAVNISDFALLAGRFNLPGTLSQGDFNYDGVTNISDFAILASKFNTTLPAPSDLPTNRISAQATLAPLLSGSPTSVGGERNSRETTSHWASHWNDKRVIELVEEHSAIASVL